MLLTFSILKVCTVVISLKIIVLAYEPLAGGNGHFLVNIYMVAELTTTCRRENTNSKNF